MFRENQPSPEMPDLTRESSLDSIGTMSFSSDAYSINSDHARLILDNPEIVELNPEQAALINAFSNLDFLAVEEVLRNIPQVQGPPPLSERELEQFKDVVADRELIKKLQGDKCAICQDQIKERDTLKILKCGHSFHSTCIVPWFKHRCTCPVCRQVQGDENVGEDPQISAVLQLEDQMARFEIENEEFLRRGRSDQRRNLPLRSVSEDDLENVQNLDFRDRSTSRPEGIIRRNRISPNSHNHNHNHNNNHNHNQRRGFSSLIRDQPQDRYLRLMRNSSITEDYEDEALANPLSIDEFSEIPNRNVNNDDRRLNNDERRPSSTYTRLNNPRRGSLPSEKNQNLSDRRRSSHSIRRSRRRTSHSSRSSLPNPNRQRIQRTHSSSPPQQRTESRLQPSVPLGHLRPFHHANFASRQPPQFDPGRFSPRTNISSSQVSDNNNNNILDFRTMSSVSIHNLMRNHMEFIRRSQDIINRASDELQLRAMQRDMMMCPKCNVRPPANLLSPCRHLGLCANCQLADDSDRCPVCNHEINRQIYINAVR